MGIKRVESPVHVSASGWTEVRDWERKRRSSRRFGRMRVRFACPIRKLKRKAVVLSTFKQIQFLRRIRIRPVVSGEHLAAIIPAKPISVAQPVTKDFELWLFLRGIEPPDIGSDRQFPASVVARICASLIPISSRAAAHVKHAVGAKRDVTHSVVERTNAPWVRGPKP